MQSTQSKTIFATVLFAALVVCITAIAQVGSTDGGYDLTWHTIDGGGGSSVGASFELSGTIGQPDAGSMSGGNFELHGGFWLGDALPGPTCGPDIAPPGGDGLVNANDLLAVINGWGACAEPCPPTCTADITADCTVNANDLLAVINGWGICP